MNEQGKGEPPKMRQGNFKNLKFIEPKLVPCRCCMAEPTSSDDMELRQLFQNLALTLLRQMDYSDADVIARFEFHGQTLSEIARETGCSNADATRRLKHAQRCLCQLVVLTLVPVKSE